MALAEPDIIRRQWTLPELTPIIETSGGPEKSDPFASDQNIKAIKSFNRNQLINWLKANGVTFPPGSFAMHGEGT